jgi:hypothetical protein
MKTTSAILIVIGLMLAGADAGTLAQQVAGNVAGLVLFTVGGLMAARSLEGEEE